MGGAWTGLIWLRIRVGRGYCECGNKLSDSIKCNKVKCELDVTR